MAICRYAGIAPKLAPRFKKREPCTKSARSSAIGSNNNGISSGESLLLPATVTVTS